MNDEERVTYFGETDARNKRLRFGIKKKDRSRHMYVIGKTGMGKSTLLENLAIQDIQNGEGLAFIDPHGKTADLLLEYVPEHRIKDVVYFAPFDLDYPISFNVLEDVGAEKRHLVANGLMSAFKKIWVDAWSARMEYILTNILLALLEFPGSTLMGVNRMLTDKDFRKTVVDNITDPSVKAFWVEEYAKYTDKFAAEAAPAIQNKVGQFVANPLVRNIIGQPKSSFDIRKIMDEKKILIINLSKGRVGEANANLLGAMIITKIYLAAMSRADLKEDELKKAAQFYLYVDEFQSFANESFADILSEARKYKLNLTIAHQYIEQMTEEVRAAVFGNVGTMVVFRVGAYDADVFQKEFTPQFTAEDIVNLQMYQMYLKLMIDGVTSTPFSAKGMVPIPKPEKTYVSEIIESSREQFASPRDKVEEEIRNWHIEKIKSPSSGSNSNAFSDDTQSHGQGVRENNQSNNSRNTNHNNYNRNTASSYNSERDRSAGQHGNRENRDGRENGRDNNRDNNRVNRENNLNRESVSSDRNERSDRPDRNGNRSEYRNEPRFNDRDSFRDSKNHDRTNDYKRPEDVPLNHLHEKRNHEARVNNVDKSGKPQNVLALKEALLGLVNSGELKTVEKEKNNDEKMGNQSKEVGVDNFISHKNNHKEDENNSHKIETRKVLRKDEYTPKENIKGHHEDGKSSFDQHEKPDVKKEHDSAHKKIKEEISTEELEKILKSPK